MWKFIKECWNDWIMLENELAKDGIFRIYTLYGVFEYYDSAEKKENTVESKKDTVV
jgi:hypothetical protein